MKHCTMAKQPWRLVLVEYLATPLDSNPPSPSELNGCKFNSLLQNISTFSSKHSDVLVIRHDAQLQHDKRGRTLPELPVGSKVGYRNHTTNQFNIGIISAKNRWTDAPFESQPQPIMSKFAKSQHAPSPNSI